MSPQERLDYLLESVFTPNEQGVTLTEVEAALAGIPGASDTVLATFTAAQQPTVNTVDAIAKAGRMQSAFIAMSSEKGLSLAGPDRQAMIDQLALSGGWPDVVRDTVKALGGVWQPRWQLEGYGSEPTLATVTAELADTETSVDETRHGVLLTVNRRTDGTVVAAARVIPAEYSNGVLLRYGKAVVRSVRPEDVAALTQIVEGMIDG